MLHTSIALATVIPLRAKDDFWIAKPIEQWSEEEIRKLHTKSPWAKEVTVTPGGLGGGGMRGGPDASSGGMGGGMGGGGDMGGGGGDMGGGMGGMGGGGGRGGRGGGRGMPGGGGGMPEMKFVVRWESALPVRKSSRIQWPPDTDGNYILSVSGLPRMGQRPPGSGAEQKAEGGRQRPPQDRERMQDQIRAATELRRKNHAPQQPELVRIFESGPRNMLVCLFPIGKDPITAAEKEVTFFTRMGPIEVKTKFNLKEMEFQGALAL
jgi:hypothetical protein